MRLTIRDPMGRMIPVNVNGPDESIEFVKLRIFQQENIQPFVQNLVYQSQVLDDNRSLQSYQIGEGGIVNLVVKQKENTSNQQEQRQFEIFVKTLTGKTLTLQVRQTDTVLQVKQKIQELERVPPCQQRLVFARREMEDDQSLQDYNVQRDATMHLVMRLQGA
ncbi:MAG: putative Ubiquitin [Streblomastix strix]|uniref:Putative Ubiquitin n=1 Tax=Streblomastix strix TaxID=222440 RepID=A0A5J4V9C3_9EUKA|nr:MAG: putative Ubiquitin [Streblomastix strix]